MSLAMWFAYLLRDDVRAGAAPRNTEAQQEFVSWWMLWGQKEYPAVWHWHSDQTQIAMRLVSVGPDLLCPRALRRLHASRPDLQNAFPLDDQESLFEFFCWYRLYGASELSVAPELPLDCLAMTESASERPRWRAGGLAVPRIATILAQRIPGLLSDSDDDSRDAVAVLNWYVDHGKSLIPRARSTVDVAMGVRPEGELRSGGVNLVGFVRGQFGLGEDVRMAAACLEAAGIGHALIDVPAGPVVPQQDHSLAHRLTDKIRYDVTVYCMSAFDMATLYLRRGPAFFADQYRVGYWPWELPRFPAVWSEVFTLVDEIWVGSEFTADAYRAGSSHPVHCLPFPVDVSRVKPVERRLLRLHDQSAFAFVFSYDVNSYFARKNPIAVVRAFREAFPPGERGVALLLRMNGDPNGHRGWGEVATEIADDDRITVLAATLSRSKALGVVAACDCFVSPHRAEGFGRNIAEAILLEVPVLATGFSGCMDFLSEDEMIACELKPVRKGDYPFAEGLAWAEPSIDHMARRMREIRLARLTDRPGIEQKLAMRRSEIARRYSPRAASRKIAQRLRDIELGLSGTRQHPQTPV